MVAVQNIKGEIIQLILSRKGGACTLYTQLLLNCLLNLYETLHSCSTQPADVHEGIPLRLKFRRGDNSTYTFTKRGVVYLVSAIPPKRRIGVL
jgi:hypothetical protein